MEHEQRVSELLAKQSYDVYDLAQIVSLLRSEHGCPWDKVQTHTSIKSDLIEEAYEVLEAIDCSSADMLREELGDVLLQVVFHADIEKDAGNFSLDDVADEVCRKLILRHPHVFGDVQADTVDKVLSNWDAIKKEEKSQQTYTDTLKSVPKNFPALMRAQKLGKRAARAGIDFDNDNPDRIEADMYSAIRSALDNVRLADVNDVDASGDIGNLLMLCANLARRLDCDAEECLADSCNDFVKRFEELETKNGNVFGTAAGELYSY